MPMWKGRNKMWWQSSYCFKSHWCKSLAFWGFHWEKKLDTRSCEARWNGIPVHSLLETTIRTERASYVIIATFHGGLGSNLCLSLGKLLISLMLLHMFNNVAIISDICDISTCGHGQFNSQSIKELFWFFFMLESCHSFHSSVVKNGLLLFS